MAEDDMDGPGGAVDVRPYPLRILGTTWLDRGPRYWARRALLALAGLLVYGGVCVLYGALSWAFVLHPLPRPWRPAGTAVLGAAALAALGLGFARQWRIRAVPVDRDGLRRIRLRGREGAERGQALSWLLALVPPVSLALCAYGLGQIAAVLPLRRTPAELGARQDYERRLAAAREEERREVRRAGQRGAPRNGPSWR
jgi:hypothetical protein